jgi:small basic protein (TIGR04137 family)
MSIHRSLKTSGTLARDRNVWSRLERILALKKDKRWKTGDSIFALPKVRTRFKVKGKKKEKAAAVEGAPGAAAPAAAGAAAPAAAAGAKGAPAAAAAAKPDAKAAAGDKKGKK